METPETIYRHGQPGHLDMLPNGTKCLVERGSLVDVYYQVSLNDEHPVWEFAGTLPTDSDDEALI